MFKEKRILDLISSRGYYIAPLLENIELNSLNTSFKQLNKLAKESINNQFWPSGRHPDSEIRNFAKNAIEKIVPNKLKTLVNEEDVEFIGGTYLVKPPSRKSILGPHQDSSHVDERNEFSVYAWIPLQNVNRWNGCFHYLPGSHQWGIHQRSLNVEWSLKDKLHILQKNMKPIPMKAGDVLFFHSALIHSSPANYTFKSRIAVNYYLHPKKSPFCHFYEDEDTPEGKVEMYSVTPEFFYNEDFQSRPDKSKYSLIDIIEKSPFDWKDIELKLSLLSK